MKEKKIKRKQLRKIPVVILAMLVMASALSVFAFASESRYPCDCGYVTPSYEEGSAPYDDGEFIMTCSVCGESYSVKITKVEYGESPCRNFAVDAFFVISIDFDLDGYPVLRVSQGHGPESDCDICGFDGECSCEVAYYTNPKYASTTDAPKGMVGKMVAAITTSVTAILGGVGSAIVGFFDSTVLAENGQLSTFAVWLLAFLGIAFALGVVKFITNLVRKR